MHKLLIVLCLVPIMVGFLACAAPMTTGYKARAKMPIQSPRKTEMICMVPYVLPKVTGMMETMEDGSCEGVECLSLPFSYSESVTVWGHHQFQGRNTTYGQWCKKYPKGEWGCRNTIYFTDGVAPVMLLIFNRVPFSSADEMFATLDVDGKLSKAAFFFKDAQQVSEFVKNAKKMRASRITEMVFQFVAAGLSAVPGLGSIGDIVKYGVDAVGQITVMAMEIDAAKSQGFGKQDFIRYLWIHDVSLAESSVTYHNPFESVMGICVPSNG